MRFYTFRNEEFYMESRETTARAHFQEKVQFREVRETLEWLKQTPGRTVFPPWVLGLFFKRLQKQNFM